MIKKKFLDPNIKNKSKTVEDKIQLFDYAGVKLPLPTEIEISESGTCNRSCSFCPRSAKDFVDKKPLKLDLNASDDEIIDKIAVSIGQKQ